MNEKPPRLAVDAEGYVWRVYGDHWSMARVNPDNKMIPRPVTFYVPATECGGDGCFGCVNCMTATAIPEESA